MAETQLEAKSEKWYIFDAYTKAGGKITCKVSDPKEIISDFEHLMNGIQEVVNKYHITLTPPPLPTAPASQIPLRDENNVPVVNAEKEPVMVDLPASVGLFTVKALWHGKTKDGKSILKVTTVEPQYDTKFGVNCFGDGPQGWEAWAIDAHYAPPPTHAKVLIRASDTEHKYPRIEGFRPA